MDHEMSSKLTFAISENGGNKIYNNYILHFYKKLNKWNQQKKI